MARKRKLYRWVVRWGEQMNRIFRFCIPMIAFFSVIGAEACALGGLLGWYGRLLPFYAQISFCALTTLLALFGMGYLGSVADRDFARFNDAWHVLTNLARRAMQLDREEDMAQWSSTKLAEERDWIWLLEAAMQLLRFVIILWTIGIVFVFAALSMAILGIIPVSSLAAAAWHLQWADLLWGLPSLLLLAGLRLFPDLLKVEARSDRQISDAQNALGKRRADFKHVLKSQLITLIDNRWDEFVSLIGTSIAGVTKMKWPAKSKDEPHDLKDVTDIPKESLGESGTPMGSSGDGQK